MDWTTTNPANVAFWSEAGISADAPTNGPLGRSLTDRAAERYLADDALRELARLYERLDAPNAAYRPRLETVLDALTETYGLGGLWDVLSDLQVAVPNTRGAQPLRTVADSVCGSA